MSSGEVSPTSCAVPVCHSFQLQAPSGLAGVTAAGLLSPQPNETAVHKDQPEVDSPTADIGQRSLQDDINSCEDNIRTAFLFTLLIKTVAQFY